MTENKPLSHIRLQIGCPVGDYRLDLDFSTSLWATARMIKHFGGEIDFCMLPGCSDLPAARAKILGNFYRSDFTHLLMIDSDMSWDENDVLKMLNLNKDFIAAAGMRKICGPGEFALNNCKDDGTTIPMLLDKDGVLEITEIGMAFVLVSKNFATRMIDYYRPEFEFQIIGPELPGGSQMEVDIFSPMIVPGTKRRLPEDYSACFRWRAIGGKIFVLANVELGHAGRLVWRGRLSDSLQWHAAKEVENG